MSDEEEINYLKNCSNIAISDNMSALNDNASNYMGVKTIPEGTIPDTNQKSKKMKNTKNYKETKKVKKRNKKTKSFSSSSSSSSSSFSSSSSSSSSIYSSSSSYSETQENKKQSKYLKKSKEKIQEKENIKIGVENNENTNNNEIQTQFEWNEGGNVVYITGSFCDWKKFYLMTKNNEGKFTITLPLPRGFHQYKFIIDDIWTYSKAQPKFEDNGNVNNFIDTTNYDNLNLSEEKTEKNENNNILKKEEKKEKSKKILKEKAKTKEKIKEKSKKTIKEKSRSKSKEKKKKAKSNIKNKEKINDNKISIQKRNSSTHNIHFLNSIQNDYSIYYPLRAEFSKKPLALPGLYKTYYILDEKKSKKLKERKFSQIEYVDSTNNSIYDNSSESQSLNQSLSNSLYFISDVNAYVKFHNLYHIHSNHLHSKELIPINTTVTSIISRYRYKFSTFIYYKENKPTIAIKEFDKKKHSKTFKIKRKNE